MNKILLITLLSVCINLSAQTVDKILDTDIPALNDYNQVRAAFEKSNNSIMLLQNDKLKVYLNSATREDLIKLVLHYTREEWVSRGTAQILSTKYYESNGSLLLNEK